MARAIGVTLDSYDMDFRSQEEKLITEAVKAIREDKARRKNFLGDITFSSTIQAANKAYRIPFTDFNYQNGEYIRESVFAYDNNYDFVFPNLNIDNLGVIKDTISKLTLSVTGNQRTNTTVIYNYNANSQMVVPSSVTLPVYFTLYASDVGYTGYNSNQSIYYTPIPLLQTKLGDLYFTRTGQSFTGIYGQYAATIVFVATPFTLDLSTLLDSRIGADDTYNSVYYRDFRLQNDGKKLSRIDFQRMFDGTYKNYLACNLIHSDNDFGLSTEFANSIQYLINGFGYTASGGSYITSLPLLRIQSLVTLQIRGLKKDSAIIS